MRKLLPALAGFLLAACIGVALFPRPQDARAAQAGGRAPLVRYGDVIIDMDRVIAVSHSKGELIEFTLDAARPDGTAVSIVLNKEMSMEPEYVEQIWSQIVKDLRVGN